MQLKVNGEDRAVPDAWRDDTLLTVLREALGLVGAKFGCGVGQCGACTVLIGEVATRSCLVKAAAVAERPITTIEGLARGERLHPLQQAWLDGAVAQCGYCQAGQIMSAVALLKRVPQPTDADIDAALAGNLCRCGTYPRIRQAVRRAAERLPAQGPP